MLFLFNTAVYDLGDPLKRLTNSDLPVSPGEALSLPMGHVAQLFRDAVFHEPEFHRTSPEKAKDLCALLALAAQPCNAVLALQPQGARGPQDVVLRFAEASYVALVRISAAVDGDVAPPEVVNREVWGAAA